LSEYQPKKIWLDANQLKNDDWLPIYKKNNNLAPGSTN